MPFLPQSTYAHFSWSYSNSECKVLCRNWVIHLIMAHPNILCMTWIFITYDSNKGVFVWVSDVFFRLLCSVRIEHLLRMFDNYEKWALGPRISRFTFWCNFRLIFRSVWLIYKLDSVINLQAWLQLKMNVRAKLWLEMKFNG